MHPFSRITEAMSMHRLIVLVVVTIIDRSTKGKLKKFHNYIALVSKN